MRQRILLRTILADLFVFAVYHGAMSLAAFCLLGDARPFLTAMVLLAPYFAMTAVRRRVDSLGAFVGLHFLLCMVPLFVRIHSILQAFMVLFLLLGALHSFLSRLRGGWYPEFAVTLLGVVFNAGVALFTDYLGFRQPGEVLFFWSFVMIAIFLTCDQTGRVDSSLEILSGAARQPLETTLRFNNFILGAFLAIVSAAALIASSLPLDRLGRMLVDGILALFRFIYRLILSLLALLGGGEALPEEPAGRLNLAELVPSAREAPVWLQIAERIFITLVWAAIGALLVFGVVRGLKALYLQFYRAKRQEGELREYIGPQLSLEELKGLGRRFRRRLPLFGKSEEERVRRTYYRRIRRHIRRGIQVRQADTAGEIANRLRGKEDIEALTERYNRARYYIKSGRKK